MSECQQVVLSNAALPISRIHLGIHRRFEAAGVSFAYPTQELILRRAPAAMIVGDGTPAAN